MKINWKNGDDIVQSKVEYTLTRFKTVEGLIDFFVGTAIWGFLIVKFHMYVISFFRTMFSFLTGFLLEYVSYLGFGFVSAIAGLIITITIIYIKRLAFNRR